MLSVLRIMLNLLQAGSPLPADWKDAAQVRAWLHGVEEPLADAIVAVASEMSASATLAAEAPLTAASPEVAAAALEAAVDPATIIFLVELVGQLVAWWRNRRQS